MTTFNDVCSMAAVRQCYDNGQTVASIAKSAKKSQSTVRHWLTQCPVGYGRSSQELLRLLGYDSDGRPRKRRKT